jgi:hypothetical protein
MKTNEPNTTKKHDKALLAIEIACLLLELLQLPAALSDVHLPLP